MRTVLLKDRAEDTAGRPRGKRKPKKKRKGKMTLVSQTKSPWQKIHAEATNMSMHVGNMCREKKVHLPAIEFSSFFPPPFSFFVS